MKPFISYNDMKNKYAFKVKDQRQPVDQITPEKTQPMENRIPILLMLLRDSLLY